MSQNIIDSNLIGRGFIQVCIEDAKIYIPIGILCFFTAAYFINGSSFQFLNLISYPISYGGDGWLSAWIIQRATDGWVYNDFRSGYPFGSALYDYPLPDTGSFILLKFLGKVVGTSFGAYNIFYLLGFAFAFIAAYIVLRTLRVSVLCSICIGVLYTFIPFHWLRISHLFLTYFWVAPIYCYFGFLCYSFIGGHASFKNISVKTYFLSFFALIVLSSFGVYYAAFGVLTIMILGVCGSLRVCSYKNILLALIMSAAVVCGVVANTSPSMYYKIVNGGNTEIAVRSPGEAEIYGLKLSSMIIPTQKHIYSKFRNISDKYYSTTPIRSEGDSVSFGLFGVLGFCILILVFFWRVAGNKHSIRDTDRIGMLAIPGLFLFLCGTVGGFSALFSQLISPMLRGWNRISVFIVFLSFAALGLCFDFLMKRFYTRYNGESKLLKFVPVVFFILVVGIGFIDQYPKEATTDVVAYRNYSFLSDKKIVSEIEGTLPTGAAVYQLPYMRAIEAPPVNNMSPYKLFIGVILSKKLHWSFGGINGTPGDLFYRVLQNVPVMEQLRIIKDLGFSGVLIARGGYKDRGVHIEKEFENILGYGPTIISDDKLFSFFKLPPPTRDAYKSEVLVKDIFGQIAMKPLLSSFFKKGSVNFRLAHNIIFDENDNVIGSFGGNALPPVKLEHRFSIQLIVKPKHEQVSYAHILGNHPANTGGFSIQQFGVAPNDYAFFYGNGFTWHPSPTVFSLAEEEVNYIVINYNKDTVDTYINGGLVGSVAKHGEIAQSPLMIGIGDWNGGNRQFNGEIYEGAISNALLSQEEISAAWEQIHKTFSEIK